MLQVPKPLVSANWLFQNFEDKNLIVLNGTLPKVTIKKEKSKEVTQQIKRAVFLDIKKEFSKADVKLPNTILQTKEFEKKVQKLGINQDSCIVVYDEFGIYSSSRVWWMFKLFGFENIAVLNGGFPAWKKNKYPIETKQNRNLLKGNFKATLKSKLIKDYKQLLINITEENFLVVDARSKERFLAEVPEPRKEVRRGRIPKSVSLAYPKLLNENYLKSKKELKSIFKEINPNNKNVVFSCGSGITACVLAFAAEVIEIENYAVYDGSWTEWGSKMELPIQK